MLTRWQFPRLNVHFWIFCYMSSFCRISLPFQLITLSLGLTNITVLPSCPLIRLALISHDSELWQIIFYSSQQSAIWCSSNQRTPSTSPHSLPQPPPPRKWRLYNDQSSPFSAVMMPMLFGQQSPRATHSLRADNENVSGVCRLEGRGKCWWWHLQIWGELSVIYYHWLYSVFCDIEKESSQI